MCGFLVPTIYRKTVENENNFQKHRVKNLMIIGKIYGISSGRKGVKSA